jgi:hypothetical protein
MHEKLITFLLTLTLAFTIAPQSLGALQEAHALQKSYDDSDMPEREEIRRTFELARGARVEVSTIAGSVDVETVDGNAAEVRIVRMGKTRADFDCYKIDIEHTQASLVIRHRQGPQDACHTIRDRQRVMLRLPRNIDLRLNAIAGPVTIEEIEGALRLSGIAGRVEVAQATGYSEISGISGSLHMKITRLGERGVRVSGIAGKADFRVAEDLNADISVSGILGDIDNAANLSLTKVGHSDFRGRIGSGGAPISVSGISGSVAFRRARGE